MLHPSTGFKRCVSRLAVCACLVVAAGAVSLSAQAQGGQAASTSRATDFDLSARLRDAGFSGVVTITQNGRERFRRGYGLADRAFQVPVALDTRFRIASITKLFTAVLVLKLVEQRVLDLDAPISRYLPDYPGGGSDAVTLRQLLNHTSGIAQFDRVASLDEALLNGLPNYQRPLTPAQLLALCCSDPLARPPGEGFDYNNADYIVLGKIIERVTNEPYDRALARLILEPLGLRDTGLASWDQMVPRLSPTYYRRPSTQHFANDLPFFWQNAYAAGALHSSPDDVQRFANALFEGRLLNSTSMQALLAPRLDEYGLGLWSYSFTRAGVRHRVAKRPGSIMGANSMVYRLLDRGVTIVILANSNAVDLDELAQRLAEAMLDGRSVR